MLFWVRNENNYVSDTQTRGLQTVPAHFLKGGAPIPGLILAPPQLWPWPRRQLYRPSSCCSGKSEDRRGS